MCYEAAIHECWSECALHIIEVLAVLVTKSFSSLPTAPSTSGSKREGDVWSVGYERQFAIMRGAALVMYKASPTSRLKGSAALAQLLKALCAFSCQLITTSSLSESNANLSFVCMRACIKWFRFSPNVFAGLRDYVFTAAFSRKVDDKKTANAVACNAASAAAANLCVSITIASCELSSPSATSLCTALASALLSAPSNPQLIQASAVPCPALLCNFRINSSYSVRKSHMRGLKIRFHLLDAMRLTAPLLQFYWSAFRVIMQV
jgi:hypothetical protein